MGYTRHILLFVSCIISSVLAEDLERIFAPVGQNIDINCEVEFAGKDLLHTIWYKNDVPLASAELSGKVYHVAEIWRSILTITTNFSLRIFKVKKDDAANYTCKIFTSAQNNFLTYNNTAELVVQDVPDPPGTPVISDLNSRNVTVSWHSSLVENNSPVTAYIIQIKPDGNPLDNGQVYEVSRETNHTVLRDLQPNTAYQVWVMARNAVGTSQASSPSELFFTPPERPSSPPLNLTARSVESDKIEISWQAPPQDTINGILQGYEIQYEILGENIIIPITIDGSKERVIIQGVQPFTNYKISVRAFNDADKGPASFTYVRTAEGVPEKPRIIHVSNRLPTSFVVNWEAPKKINGILNSYHLQWSHNNTLKTRIINGHLTNPMSELLSGLDPYTRYHLRVAAYTGGGSSEYSDHFTAFTDVAGPEEPNITNYTVIDSHSIYIAWEEPKTFYKSVNRYFIHYWDPKHSNNHGELIADGKETEKLITGLRTNRIYMLKVAGVTESIFSQSYYVGKFSEPVVFELVGVEPEEARQMDTLSAGTLAGILIIVALIIIAFGLFMCYRSLTCRKYYHAAFHYLAVPTNSNTPPNTVLFPPESVDENQYPVVRVEDFIEHVKHLHADSDDGFAQEFADINNHTPTDIPAEHSYHPENKVKNRYVNISAFDHSRVILNTIPGKPRQSDYINANYIDGYKKPRAYIATQGPLPNTFADFWRMVWEQGSVVIVMITNLVERGRHKCDMYWQEEGVETYGSVTVKHINTIPRAHYTVRIFSLKSSKVRKKLQSERIVYQYHYTEWPDHGVPDFTLPVLKFVKQSAKVNPPGAGPIVVHCSAGVGRTGTYILIESMIQQMKDVGTVNIPNFLLHIRKQRNFLVQTEEQYMLVHDALVEYVITQGETEVRDQDISKYVANLTKVLDGEKDSLLDKQFRIVTEYKSLKGDCSHAEKEANKLKVRCADIVPVDLKRVTLPMQPGKEGSDFINASYLQGYNKSNEFIITQHPVESTIVDFWRMVWDQNSSVIVLLSKLDGEKYPQFWPDENNTIDVDTGNFKLTYREVDERKKYSVKDFLLESTQDDYILMTRIVTPHTWPDTGSPLHSVFDLIETVQDLHKQNNMGPVIVVDSFGGEEAGLFCQLTCLYDQMTHDHSADIYQVTKLHHLKRPGVVGTKENYLYLYKAVESLIEEMSERQASPASHRLQLSSFKKATTLPRSVTINSKIETNV
ncbi:hypothetical protein ACJMK2_016867 [Sinanodonta woodiana]|uniref:protein-tyrosine-phosphatase n=1 Tax=Sinanodonta woodiana TaxID=1069815 RepID=A0ABD3UY80_SINWO